MTQSEVDSVSPDQPGRPAPYATPPFGDPGSAAAPPGSARLGSGGGGRRYRRHVGGGDPGRTRGPGDAAGGQRPPGRAVGGLAGTTALRHRADDRTRLPRLLPPLLHLAGHPAPRRSAAALPDVGGVLSGDFGVLAP